MKMEHAEGLFNSMQRGCINRLSDIDEESSRDVYDWYAKRHNELSGTFMKLQVEHYTDD